MTRAPYRGEMPVGRLPCFYCHYPTAHGGCGRCSEMVCDLCYSDHRAYHEYQDAQEPRGAIGGEYIGGVGVR